MERLDHRRLVVRGVDVEPDRARGHTHAQRLALGDGPDLVHDGVEAERPDLPPDLPGLARGLDEAGGQPDPVAQYVADGVESLGDGGVPARATAGIRSQSFSCLAPYPCLPALLARSGGGGVWVSTTRGAGFDGAVPRVLSCASASGGRTGRCGCVASDARRRPAGHTPAGSLGAATPRLIPRGERAPGERQAPPCERGSGIKARAVRPEARSS